MTCSRIVVGWGVLLLLVVASQAAEPKPLTTDGRLKKDLTLGPEGKTLVYAVQESPTLIALMELDLATGQTVRMHPDANTAEWEPTFSPDGRWFAFVQSRGNLNLQLVIRDRVGKKQADFNPGGGFATISGTSLTNDGRCVFCYPDGARQELTVVGPDGKNPQKISDSTGVNLSPQFSPDGSRLAFSSSRDGDLELYTALADGSGVTRLTTSPGRDLRPRWSPDGSRLALASFRDGNFEIYVMPAAGGEAQNVTRHAENDDHPAWSSDGKQLYWVGERSGRFDVYCTPAP